MPRFFMAGSNIGKGGAVICGSDAEHIKVLRMKLGDELIICDGEGSDHRCRIKRISDGCVETELLDSAPSPAEPSVKCTVLAGFPKGERADYIVQKCTECGAAEIVFSAEAVNQDYLHGIHVLFDVGSGMENLRAFMVANGVKDTCEDFVT